MESTVKTKNGWDTLNIHYRPGSETLYAASTFPLEMPGIPLENREDLPSIPTVYFAVSRKTGLLYIGRAKNLFERWQNHHRTVQLKRYGDVRIVWVTFNGLKAEHLPALEQACIEWFLPPLNQTHDNKTEQAYAKFRKQFVAPEEETQEEIDPGKASLSIEVLKDSDFARYLINKRKETGIKPADQVLLYAMAHFDMIRGQNR